MPRDTRKPLTARLVASATQPGKYHDLDLGAPDKTDRTDRTPPATWNIPAARMKAGRPHRVPLPPEAVALKPKRPKTWCG
jgi:hypothetical protein